MTLSPEGLDYICQNFGLGGCCVESGLTWTYQDLFGGSGSESGGTAQIISRFTLGLVESITITNPDRGTFTPGELNTANNSPVTLQDAQEIANHDAPSEGQWCLGGEQPQPPPYTTYLIGGIIAAAVVVGGVMLWKK